MVSAPSALAADRIDRRRGFETDARFVEGEAYDPPPALCFVDGEHTDAAVVLDFDVCRRALRGVGAILLHGAHVVYNGLWEIPRTLDVVGLSVSNSWSGRQEEAGPGVLRSV